MNLPVAHLHGDAISGKSHKQTGQKESKHKKCTKNRIIQRIANTNTADLPGKLKEHEKQPTEVDYESKHQRYLYVEKISNV
jgi:hypothetical protein